MLSFVSSSERAFKECFDFRVKEGNEEGDLKFLSLSNVPSATKDDFLFLGPRHRFYLRFPNKGFGTRQALLLI